MLTVWDWQEELAACVVDAIADGDTSAEPRVEHGNPTPPGIGPGECCGTGVVTTEHGERWMTSGTWPPRSLTIEQREFRNGCQELSSAQRVTVTYRQCAPHTRTEQGTISPSADREESGLSLAEAEARVWSAIICCLPRIADDLGAKVGLDNLIPIPVEGGCHGFRLLFTVELPSCCIEDAEGS